MSTIFNFLAEVVSAQKPSKHIAVAVPKPPVTKYKFIASQYHSVRGGEAANPTMVRHAWTPSRHQLFVRLHEPEARKNSGCENHWLDFTG